MPAPDNAHNARYRITTHMEKQFCFHCGNNTLRKLAVAINEHGTLQYFLSRRAPRIYKQVLWAAPVLHNCQPMACVSRTVSKTIYNLCGRCIV